tara:strand:- start:711 stop:1022 length:312 start_codon:yes stop_codon:yes gene_type:complete
MVSIIAKQIVSETAEYFEIRCVYYGIDAYDKASKIFVFDNEWFQIEKHHSALIIYNIVKHMHLQMYAKYIIGEDDRLNVVGKHISPLTMNLLQFADKKIKNNK